MSIYSNVCLEMNYNKRNEKVLELNTLYNNCISLQVDRNLNPAITFVNNCFHKHLSLKEFVPGKFRLVNEDDNDIYIILDTLEYKNFNVSAKVNFITDNFKVLRKFNMSNRTGKVKWDIFIIKVKNPFSSNTDIIEYIDTSGSKKYIVLKDGILHHYNRFMFLEKYSQYYIKSKNNEAVKEMMNIIKEDCKNTRFEFNNKVL